MRMEVTQKMKLPLHIRLLLAALCSSSLATAAEYHVSTHGNDSNNGKLTTPMKTISAAATLAQPGDTITIHQGIYRERINPPRGGTSDTQRITYRAAEGEKVVIKGSEVVKGWRHLHGDVWEVRIPDQLFGKFNPFKDLIKGDWFNPKGRKHHTGAVYLNGHWLTEARTKESIFKPTSGQPLWFAENQHSQGVTKVWAQFKDLDPNQETIEVNTRQSVFYPSKPGVNYITVSGLTLEHAATPWAPPTAEQIGLIGTHWSKGWIIENNTIRYSVCTGIALGKHGDGFDNTSANSAGGYVKTIKRAYDHGWSKANIGHHIVRNNHISHCEQAGIVGSLGAIFSKITGNEINHIHTRALFTGAEMAGIKIHGALDSLIASNHIHHCSRGIWLDWMAQGTRVTRNLLHDNGNGKAEDIFLEVNHGPILLDHNIMLSPKSIRINSQGAAFVHNLITGHINIHAKDSRKTPWLKAHSTALGGIEPNRGGDDRYYNNLFIGKSVSLAGYNKTGLPIFTRGNIFLAGAQPNKHAPSPLVIPQVQPAIKLIKRDNSYYLEMNMGGDWTNKTQCLPVTTTLLGKTHIPKMHYTQADGTPYRFDSDFLGKPRNKKSPFPGPFTRAAKGEKVVIKGSKVIIKRHPR